MSLSKSSASDDANKCSVKTEDSTSAASKPSNNLVVRNYQNSDENLQALFDSVLNPSESNRPLQVPFRMRKLPNSFFTPPAASPKSPTVSHSRANSVDSAYDCGSQPNINQASVASSLSDLQSAVAAVQASSVQLQTTSSINTQSSASSTAPQAEPPRLQICHSRAHSSPASLQQTYNLHGANVPDENPPPFLQQQPNDGAGGGSGNGAAVAPGFPNNLIGYNAATAAVAAAAGLSSSNILGLGGTGGAAPYHMKQRSYDVISPIQLQNELGPLPPGWEQAKTNDGQIYYLK